MKIFIEFKPIRAIREAVTKQGQIQANITETGNQIQKYARKHKQQMYAKAKEAVIHPNTQDC